MPYIKEVLGYKVSLVRNRATKSKKSAVFEVLPYRYRALSAIRVMLFNFWRSVTSALLYCRRFPARDFYKRYEVYCFLTPLCLPSTPVEYVIDVMVRITPLLSELPRFVTKHLFLGGKQSE